jgi:hypothetical protein
VNILKEYNPSKGEKMIVYNTPNSVLNKVANSLVAARRFSTVEDALWDLAISAVRSKMSYYRRRIKKMENKYGMDFDKFTARLKGKATPDQEDDWLDWKSARSMLADWQKTYQDLLHEQNR